MLNFLGRRPVPRVQTCEWNVTIKLFFFQLNYIFHYSKTRYMVKSENKMGQNKQWGNEGESVVLL